MQIKALAKTVHATIIHKHATIIRMSQSSLFHKKRL